MQLPKLGDPIARGMRKYQMQQTLLFPPPPYDQNIPSWTPTRAAGLERLANFLPSAGAAYTHSRNTDFGPQNRSNVSALSPWLARRLITEQEVVSAVMAAHGFRASEKFIQEVFWRTYWKGWLEMRPDVLVHFDRERLALKQTTTSDPRLSARLDKAMNAQTGIVCFDEWVKELREIGWLHNHARMWFASIWIFTLGLPWQLGADFFYKHLMDADAASNTLSWRWVGGLHTKGKHYVARASNIATHSNFRFDPGNQLNETALPLSQAYQIPGPMAPPQPRHISADKVGLLLTQEDLHPESLPLFAKVVGGAALTMPLIGPPNSARNQFLRGALRDGQSRAAEKFGVDFPALSTTQEIVDWAKSLGVTQIATAYAPTGVVAWRLREIAATLAKHGVELVPILRDWDERAWPLATGGFFKLKEKLPSLISQLTSK